MILHQLNAIRKFPLEIIIYALSNRTFPPPGHSLPFYVVSDIPPFHHHYPPLPSTCTKLIAVDRLRSGIRASVSFQKCSPPPGSVRIRTARGGSARVRSIGYSASSEIFALSAKGSDLGEEGNVRRPTKLPRTNSLQLCMGRLGS